MKFDQKKLRMDLVPPSAIEGIARALTHGAEKYEPRNWEKGIDYGRLYGAAMRHLLDWWNGSDEDDDSGLHPLDHAICDIAMLIEMRNIHPELDDRPSAELSDDRKDEIKSWWNSKNRPKMVDPVEENGRRIDEEEAESFIGAKKMETNFGTLIVNTPYEQEKRSENKEEM